MSSKTMTRTEIVSKIVQRLFEIVTEGDQNETLLDVWNIIAPTNEPDWSCIRDYFVKWDD